MEGWINCFGFRVTGCPVEPASRNNFNKQNKYE
jgi:hypothetical protein